jgi:hypothetical protein
MDIRTSPEYARKQIIDFKKMLESRLNHAFDERDENDNESAMDKLYEQDFIITFMGKSCRIAFGATEYHSIIGMLEDILEEI